MSKKKDYTKLLAAIPQSPGIYLMKNSAGKTLYVGKAKNLKARTRQYFTKGSDGRKMIDILVSQIDKIDCITTKNEREALLLELNFIQKLKPKYNSILKDDKTHLSLFLDKSNPWPRFELIRFKNLKKKQGLYFGPYTQGGGAKTLLNLIQEIFPLRRCSDHELKSRSRPCILFNMKRCIAPCVNNCTKNEYDTNVSEALNFLRGQRSEVIARLQKKRDEASKSEAFETASHIHNSIEQIKELLQEKKGIVQRKGEDADIFGFWQKENFFMITKLVFKNCVVQSSQEFKFPYIGQSDQELFTSFLTMHYKEYEPNKNVFLPCSVNQTLLKDIFPEIKRFTMPKMGHKKELVLMANENAQLSLERQLQNKDDLEKVLSQLQKELHLKNYPSNIECIDISHFSSSNCVGASISFIDGKRASSLDRIFKIKWAKNADDYAATKEVLMRRLTNRNLKALANLIIIDGGRGHLNSAKQVLDELNLAGIDLISISKESSKHNKALVQEQIHIFDKKTAILLEPNSKLLHFIQRIRDATHNKAINFQKAQRKF